MNTFGREKFVTFFYNDYESLGIEYISAVLRKEGVKTKLIYKNLIDYYAFDSSRKIDGKLYQKIASEICSHNPDVLALSLLTDTFKANMLIASFVKELNPKIKILAGGVHASLLPQLTLSYPQIDAISIGEGEFSVLAYMQSLDAIYGGEFPLLKGIVYKQNERLIGSFLDYTINEELDKIPFPDKDLFYNEDPSMKSHYFVQCSRGCPFACSFCINDYLNSKVGGKRFRYRSPENIIEELMLAKQKYSPSFVAFLDECFGFDKEWITKFLNLYKDKIALPFLASIHPNIVTPQLADLMQDANCAYVAMGVQSLNENISKTVLKRSIKRDKVAKAIELIRSRNMILQCDHIFGIPGENRSDMLDTLSFYNENRPSLVSVYWLSFYPKAYITEFAREKGIISEQDIEDIENGKISSGIKRVYGYYDINFWMNYFIFLNKNFIRWVINSGFLSLFKIKNIFISSAFPRALFALLHKRDWNRYYMRRVIMKKINNLKVWGPS
ncbi:MAG: B12-binding domain-containing radical SAM protein [Candidatus Omnitrophica bacterium]|jgi:anaerobic magnesium-protoporphyrin IX monomethyl ester cyclase|nr:B12-binding domain-containing radical SAM protein [Candidatus Omnitrophota bacterium]